MVSLKVINPKVSQQVKKCEKSKRSLDEKVQK